MLHTVMAFLPLAFLIVYALKTRKMADAMVLATLLAVLLVHRQHFFTGLIDAMYTTLGNSSYQFALCSILGFGGMISLFQASGGLMGFRDLLAKAANTPRKTLLLAWLLSVIMFVDEYLNALTTTICLRDVSDKNRLPREHLAVQTNIMACCLCVTVPFTSWTAFSVGLISDFGLGFTDYLQAVPFMFYPLAMMLVSLLMALGWFPKVGMLRQAYHRVASGGAAFEPGEKDEKLVDIDEVDEHNVSSAWNAIIPLAALVGGTVLFDNDLLHGIIVCLVVQDVVMSRFRLFGGTTDLAVSAILLITILEGTEVGSLFVLIASTLYYFSGSAPSAFCVGLMTFLGTLIALLRQMYLHRSRGSIILCTSIAMMLYELGLFLVGVMTGLTLWSRLPHFLFTGLYSVLTLIPLYSLIYKIGLIGGNTWKE